MELIIGIIILFFASVDAWQKGDDSMSRFVILVLIIVGICVIGACSA